MALLVLALSWVERPARVADWERLDGAVLRRAGCVTPNPDAHRECVLLSLWSVMSRAPRPSSGQSAAAASRPSAKEAALQFSRGHPVADNPLRLLCVDPEQDWDLWELRERADRLAQRYNTAPAPELPPLAAEPAQAFCSRRRTGKDYTHARNELHDAIAFAEALAFLPDGWVEPKRPIGQANWLFLKAEGLPTGDPRRAEWIGRGLAIWDSAQSGLHLEEVLAETLRAFGPAELAAQPQPLTLAILRECVDSLLVLLAEEALTEIGCDSEDPEMSKAGAAWIELLNGIERLRRLSQPEGVAAAEQRLLRRLQRPADEFVETAQGLGVEDCFHGTLAVKDLPTPSATQIHSFVSGLRKVRAASALAAKRPTLAGALEATHALRGLDGLRVLAAWAIGVRAGAWAEAAEVLNGVERDALERCEKTDVRHTMRLACAVIPALAAVQNSGGADQKLVAAASETLARLRREFPELVETIEQLEHSVSLSALAETEDPALAPIKLVTRSAAGLNPSPKALALARDGSTVPDRGKARHADQNSRPSTSRFPRTPVSRKLSAGGGSWLPAAQQWRTVGQVCAGLLVAAGAFWFFTRAGVGQNQGMAPASATVPAVAQGEVATPRLRAGSRPPGPASDDDSGMARFTDSRGRTYRVPLGVLGDIQTEARAIERKRLQVEEMRASLEAYKARLAADRQGRGGFASSSQTSMEAKADGLRRERELVREQEKVLQSMVEEFQSQLNRL